MGRRENALSPFHEGFASDMPSFAQRSDAHLAFFHGVALPARANRGARGCKKFQAHASARMDSAVCGERR